MTLTPRARQLALTAHVTSSVGWTGAVLTFFALSVVGLTSADAEIVRAVYLIMDVLGWSVLVPFAFATLVTGLVQSLGSAWGLFRHYWVLAKLVITLFATGVLLLYLETLSVLGDAAAAPRAGHDMDALRSASPLLHALAALILLVTATTLAIYKPRGLTPYGQRRQRSASG